MIEPECTITRILMTADTVGGVWSYVLLLSRLLVERGSTVVLATMGEPPCASQRRQAQAIGVELLESKFRLEWMEEPWDDVARAGQWLLEVARRVRPDLIHLNGYCHAALPFEAPVVVAAHSCVLSWCSAVRGGDAVPVDDRYRGLVTRGVHAARAVVAPTRAMLHCIEQHYGRPAWSEVIPNASDPSLFRPAVKEPFVMSVGRLWDEGKNIAALCRVAPRIAWPLMVAGHDRGPGGEHVPVSSVRALGWLDPPELGAWLARASIYALPARYEPFGLSALEAGLSGCALVLGDIPSLREVWQDAAVYVAPDDHRGLARAIQSLIRDPYRRCALGLAARRRGLEYSPSRMRARYEALYRSVLAGAPGSRTATMVEHEECV
jgi:glycosyltransferase involved in cell wall biosynthesis